MNNNQSNTNYNTNIHLLEQLSNELSAVHSGMQEVLDYIGKVSTNQAEDGQTLRVIAHSAPHVEQLGFLTDSALNYARKKLDDVIDAHYSKDVIPNE